MSRLPPWIGESVRELWLRLADTRLLGYRHALRPHGFGAPPAAAASQVVLDLDRLPLADPAPALVVSHAYRHSDLPHYPSIESWVLQRGISCGQAAGYRRIQFHTIRRQLAKPARRLDEPMALLPHLTSHFGHWVGDQLGALLWFAADPQLAARGRRLLATAPSPSWEALLRQLCPTGSLLLVTPEELLRANLRCGDALLLPRLSSWQNLAIARDRLAAVLEPAGPQAPGEKLFLTGGRPARIANLDAVCACFRAHGYTVLNPTGLEVLPLLQRLRWAGRLWCEHGSMVLNLLLCRTQPYRLLELDPACAQVYPAAAAVQGGSLYNAVQRGLIQPFHCPPAEPSPQLDRQLHPYQRQLRVDLGALEAALSLEPSCP